MYGEDGLNEENKVQVKGTKDRYLYIYLVVTSSRVLNRKFQKGFGSDCYHQSKQTVRLICVYR